MGIWRRIGNALRNEEDSYLIGDTVEIIRKGVLKEPNSVQKRRWERLQSLLERHFSGKPLSSKEYSAINFLMMTLQHEFRTFSPRRRYITTQDKRRFLNDDLDLDKDL